MYAVFAIGMIVLSLPVAAVSAIELFRDRDDGPRAHHQRHMY